MSSSGAHPCRFDLIGSSMASVLLLLLGGSMLVSSACTFLLLLSFSQGAVICWQCLFYGASVAAWNGLEVISVELYPSSKRYSFFFLLEITTFTQFLRFETFPRIHLLTEMLWCYVACISSLCLWLLQRDSVWYPEWDLQIRGHHRQLCLRGLHWHHENRPHLLGLRGPRLWRSGSTKAA